MIINNLRYAFIDSPELINQWVVKQGPTISEMLKAEMKYIRYKNLMQQCFFYEKMMLAKLVCKNGVIRRTGIKNETVKIRGQEYEVVPMIDSFLVQRATWSPILTFDFFGLTHPELSIEAGAYAGIDLGSLNDPQAPIIVVANRNAIARRVEVPTFELTAHPTIQLQEVRERRFHSEAPPLTFQNDNDTGMYFADDGNVGIGVSSQGILNFSDPVEADTDFQITYSHENDVVFIDDFDSFQFREELNSNQFQQVSWVSNPSDMTTVINGRRTLNPAFSMEGNSDHDFVTDPANREAFESYVRMTKLEFIQRR